MEASSIREHNARVNKNNYLCHSHMKEPHFSVLRSFSCFCSCRSHLFRRRPNTKHKKLSNPFRTTWSARTTHSDERFSHLYCMNGLCSRLAKLIQLSVLNEMCHTLSFNDCPRGTHYYLLAHTISFLCMMIIQEDSVCGCHATREKVRDKQVSVSDFERVSIPDFCTSF